MKSIDELDYKIHRGADRVVKEIGQIPDDCESQR